MDWDLADIIEGASIFKDSDIKVSDSKGWANWTDVSGIASIKVKWYGFWVNGTINVFVFVDKK